MATYAGVEGEEHAGLTRPACSRVIAQYPRDTEIRNVRQFSVLSAEELAQIAADMGIERLDPAWLGASIVLEGIADLTHLPPSSRLQNAERHDAGRGHGEPALPSARKAELTKHVPGKGRGFKAAAEGRRGVTAWVEREGPSCDWATSCACMFQTNALGRISPRQPVARRAFGQSEFPCDTRVLERQRCFRSETVLRRAAATRTEYVGIACCAIGQSRYVRDRETSPPFARARKHHELQVRHRDRPRSQQEADPGDRRETGHPSDDLLPYGHDKAKVSQDFINSVQGNETAS